MLKSDDIIAKIPPAVATILQKSQTQPSHFPGPGLSQSSAVYCRANQKSYAEISVDVALEHFPYLFVLSVDAFLHQTIFLGLLRAIRLCTPNYGRRRKRNGRD